MSIVLWVVAGVLAGVSLVSGVRKLTRSAEALAASGYGWVEDVGGRTVKVIGALEVLGAVGLILPGAVGVLPVLVPLAAVGLALLMAGAIITHVRRGEFRAVALPVILLVLLLFVAWGRFGPFGWDG